MKTYFRAPISLLDDVTNGSHQHLARIEGAYQIVQDLNDELWQLLFQNGFSSRHLTSSAGNQPGHFV